eukprot:TRINITY_DN969_c7_g1_i1.p1 TRINITY_DN969_c7_g1~~TRINITY_DN969_c7_g1_i1.p1  ORF type:complete len:751 (+),score=167.80 TRINITY_DN969_c7_g1_i1:250-2253(+)
MVVPSCPASDESMSSSISQPIAGPLGRRRLQLPPMPKSMPLLQEAPDVDALQTSPAMQSTRRVPAVEALQQVEGGIQQPCNDPAPCLPVVAADPDNVPAAAGQLAVTPAADEPMTEARGSDSAVQPALMLDEARPDAVEGKGKGPSAPPKGKGKGKAAGSGPPLPEQDKGKGKGKGGKGCKGKESARSPPPDHLLAPQGSPTLRLRSSNILSNTEGTLWHGLSPWDAVAGVGVLECTFLDLDKLRGEFASLQQEARSDDVEVQDREVQEATRPKPRANTCLNSVEIAVKAVKLTPELVQAALLQDLSVLTPDQARALIKEVAPKANHPEIQKHLQALEDQAVDPMTFGTPVKIMLAIRDIPQSLDVISILDHHHSLDEEVALAQQRVEGTETLVQALANSQSLKTILQTILVLRNVFSQQECLAFKLDSLGDLGKETLGTSHGRSSSILSHLVHNLVESHNQGHRLRFFRQQAVCKFLPSNALRRLVWGYLDSSEISPLDAVPFLQACDPDLCDGEIPKLFEQRVTEMKELVTISKQLIGGDRALVHTAKMESQLRSVQQKAAAAWEVFSEGRQRLSAAVHSLCRLGGSLRMGDSIGTAASAQQWSTARDTLRHLQGLGAQIQNELERTGRGRRIQGSCPNIELGVRGTTALSALRDGSCLRRFSCP